jgi:hypothetical protein
MKAQLSRFPHDLVLGAESSDCLSSTPASAGFQAESLFRAKLRLG